MIDPYLDQAKEAYADDQPQYATAAALIAIAEQLTAADDTETVTDLRERLRFSADRRRDLMYDIDQLRNQVAELEEASDHLVEDLDKRNRTIVGLISERDELAEIVANSDHTAAKYWRRMRAAEKRADAAEHGWSHLYVSTYCQHGEHRDCRLSCKVCSAACLCPCHRGDDDR